MGSLKLKLVSATISLLIQSNPSLAQEKPHEQLGIVSFPTSCDRKVQPQFDRAVAMLHSFWFQQVKKHFAIYWKAIRAARSPTGASRRF